jgi:hypothetical protein
MTRIRLYTENVNYPTIEELAFKWFPDGFTVFKGIGHWGTVKENSVCIEVVTESDETSAMDRARKFAYAVRKANSQDCVLCTCETVNAEML